MFLKRASWRWLGMMAEVEKLRGYIQRVVYASGDFSILAFFVEDESNRTSVAEVGMERVERNITAKGNFFGLLQVKRDVPITLIGRWKKHAKFGNQFTIQSWEPWAKQEDDVVYFLQTCVGGWMTRGVAEAVVRRYGLGTFEALSERPAAVIEALTEVDHRDAQAAVLGWQTAIATRDLSGLLKDGGLNALEVGQALRRFGHEAGAVVRDNPFRLMEIRGFSFPKVDRLATHLGVNPNASKRIEGAVLWAMNESTNEGHVFLRRSQVPETVTDMMRRKGLMALTLGKDPTKLFAKALQDLVDRGALILESGVGVYLPELYDFERESASLLAGMLSASDLGTDLDSFLEEYERSNGIRLSDAQRQAVEELANNSVLVLTGLPGTGKTTAVRALVRFFEESEVSFVLMAPTGIAAKRMASVTGHPASTIHRALHYDGLEWGYHADNKYVTDAVIVDEMSMVDQELCYRLLSALRSDTMMVLVGDDAQLPSVGPGNVLRELVACDAIPNVRLTQIFRQSEKGEIVINSHRINRGEMVSLVDPRESTEFKFVRLADEDKIVDLIVQMARKLKDRDANFQVLSAKYGGTVGVHNLNERLRDELNPEGPPEWKRGSQHFRLGDRLMVVKNDYKRNVYNGDVGKLLRIGRDNLMVKIHGVGDGLDMEVEFTFAAAEAKLRLAYAVTVHKSQGSEFDTIILPIVRSQGWMLQRNLLYTAVTRARRRVWLIGEEAAIHRAINNNRVVTRNTAFADAIRSCLTGVEEDHERRDEEGPSGGTNGRSEDSARPD